MVAYIISYMRVDSRRQSESGTLNLAPDERSVVISGLEPGATYSFSVTAQNSEGMNFTETVTLPIPPGKPNCYGFLINLMLEGVRMVCLCVCVEAGCIMADLNT